MANFTIKRLATLPAVLEVSTMYVTKNATNTQLVDLTFVGNVNTDVRKVLGQADVQSAIDTAIANLTADQIPSLPGSKIISDITVNTSGNAATADVAKKLAPGATINGVNFTGEAPIVVPAEDTATPRVKVSDIGTTVPPLVDGKVPTEYLPLSLDNIDSFPTRDDFPATGREDVIYVAKDSNFMYRWDGADYVQVGGGGSVSDTANKLTQARQIALTGDATGSTMFDGSKPVDIPVVLKNTGTAGKQGPVVTTDAQGRVVSSEALVAADIPSLPGTKITTAITVDTSGNAATATKLKTAQSVTLQGDVIGTATWDGSGPLVIDTTVAGGTGTSGLTGEGIKVTYQDGLAKSAAPLVAADIPNLPGSKITSTLSVDTTGNAATATNAVNADNATHALTADALTIVAEW